MALLYDSAFKQIIDVLPYDFLFRLGEGEKTRIWRCRPVLSHYRMLGSRCRRFQGRCEYTSIREGLVELLSTALGQISIHYHLFLVSCLSDRG